MQLEGFNHGKDTTAYGSVGTVSFLSPQCRLFLPPSPKPWGHLCVDCFSLTAMVSGAHSACSTERVSMSPAKPVAPADGAAGGQAHHSHTTGLRLSLSC